MNILRIMESAIQAGGAHALTLQGDIADFADDNKGHDGRDIATIADHESQELIFAILKSSTRDIPIIGEEDQSAAQREELHKAPRRWVVDPVDGSTNFRAGSANWGVAISLLEGNEPVAGAMYAPALDKLIVAAKGEGCFLNGSEIEGTIELPLKQSIIGMEWGWWIDSEMAAKQYRVAQEARGTHGVLSAIVSGIELLQGITTGYVNLHRLGEAACIWDFAAAAIALQEKTGRPLNEVAKSPNGDPINWRTTSIEAVLAYPHTMEQLLPLLI